jgi:hypothetical protein
VPWIGGVAGPAWLHAVDPNCGLSLSEPCDALRVSLEVPMGLDYRVTPRLSVGVTARVQVILLGPQPWTTLGGYAKVGWSWGR